MLKFQDWIKDETTQRKAIKSAYEALETVNRMRRRHDAETLSRIEFSQLDGVVGLNECAITADGVLYKIGKGQVTATLQAAAWPEMLLTGLRMKGRKTC